MSKEEKVQLYILLASFIAVLVSFFIGIKFGLIYLIIFFIIIFCASFFFLIQLYIRIQHNIDNSIIVANIRIKHNIDNSIIVANEITKIKVDLDSKLSGEKELYEEIVSFFDNMLSYLEENKKELAELKELQNKLIVIMQQILECQQDQTLFLKKQIEKTEGGPVES